MKAIRRLCCGLPVLVFCGWIAVSLTGCSRGGKEAVGRYTPRPGQQGTFESFIYKGPVPKTFHEAPMLANMVKAGTLPPVEDRLPGEPLVVPCVERIGTYGGTWRRAFTGTLDNQNRDRIMHDHLLYFDFDGRTVMPHIARDWKVSEDGKEFTFYLREGMRWSDGAPLTADDFIFTYEDMLLNKELWPAGSGSFKTKGKMARIEKLDDYSFRYTFRDPNHVFLEMVAGLAVAGQSAAQSGAIVAPRHYLKQFHPKYAEDPAALTRMVREAGYSDWTRLFMQKASIHQNPEAPVLGPWMTKTPITGTTYILERNPYYFAIDPAGNQLPYIDRIVMRLAQNLEILNQWAVNGELDMQHRHIQFDKVPVLRDPEFAGKGEYGVLLWPELSGADAAAFVNQTWKGDPELERWLRSPDFRAALSLAVDRDEINDSVFLGVGEPRGFMPFPNNPYYPGKEYERFKKRDVAGANAILDKLGLAVRDEQGYRTRADGKGPLALNLHVATAAFVDFEQVANLLANHWKEIGIKLYVKSEERKLYSQRVVANEHQLDMWGTGGSENPWTYPAFTIPMASGVSFAPDVGRWYQTGGKDGTAPAGDLRRLLEIYEEGVAVPAGKRIALGRELWRIHVKNQYVIGTVGRTPAFNGVVVVKNHFRNVPDKAPNSSPLQNPGIARPEQFFFDVKE